MSVFMRQNIIRLVERAAALVERRPRLACLLAGALVAPALPPYGVFPLIFVALPVLWRALQGAAPRAAFGRGFLFAFGMLTCSLYWIANSMLVDLAAFWWAIPFSVFGLPLYLSLYTGAAAALFAAINRRHPLTPAAGAFLLAALLSLAELARGMLLTGFPWNLAGQVW